MRNPVPVLVYVNDLASPISCVDSVAQPDGDLSWEDSQHPLPARHPDSSRSFRPSSPFNEKDCSDDQGQYLSLVGSATKPSIDVVALPDGFPVFILDSFGRHDCNGPVSC
jgi:hypothetical protein